MFRYSVTEIISSSSISLKSVCFGRPSRLRSPFEFSFRPLCPGLPESAKNISMSFLLLISFKMIQRLSVCNFLSLFCPLKHSYRFFFYFFDLFLAYTLSSAEKGFYDVKTEVMWLLLKTLVQLFSIVLYINKSRHFIFFVRFFIITTIYFIFLLLSAYI